MDLDELFDRPNGRPRAHDSVKVTVWRKMSGASIAETARRFGISTATVKRYEAEVRGQTAERRPSYPHASVYLSDETQRRVKQLALDLGVKANDLYVQAVCDLLLKHGRGGR